MVSSQPQGLNLERLVKSAVNLLKIVRSETPDIIVALSFGKDSLVTLDLCTRIFEKIYAFYLYRLPGVKIIEKYRRLVKRRYKNLKKVMMVPHFDLSRIFRNAVLMPHWRGLEETPSVSFREVEDYVRLETGVEWVAYGWRRNESINRALIFKKCGGIDFNACRVFPIWQWQIKHVYAYLDMQKIPRPPLLGRKNQGGFDFHPEALKYLRDHEPETWRRWLECFPFSPVMLCSEESESHAI